MNVTLEQTAVSPGYEVLTFGRFRLDPVQHVLREGDKTLRLGSRALELLIVLTQRTGEVGEQARADRESLAQNHRAGLNSASAHRGLA